VVNAFKISWTNNFDHERDSARSDGWVAFAAGAVGAAAVFVSGRTGQ